MKSWKLGYKNALYHSVSGGFTILLLAVSFALLSVVFSVETQLNQQIKNNTQRVDAVIGPKGGSIPLVLSSVLYADQPTGTVPFSFGEKLRKNRLVKHTTAIALGDQYNGFKLVGTDSIYRKIHALNLQQGRWPRKDNEVVLGAYTAQQNALQLDDELYTRHGVNSNTKTHPHALRVVGILQPSHSVNDRMLFCALHHYWNVHQSETLVVSAFQVQFTNALGLMQIPRAIAQNTPYQAAVPAYEMERLGQLIGSGTQLFQWIGYALLLLALLALWVQIHLRFQSRLKELALLRLHGFSPAQLMLSFLVECWCMVLPALFLALLLSRLALLGLNSLENLPLPFESTLLGEEWLFGAMALVISALIVALSTAQLFRLNLHRVLKG